MPKNTWNWHARWLMLTHYAGAYNNGDSSKGAGCNTTLGFLVVEEGMLSESKSSVHCMPLLEGMRHSGEVWVLCLHT
jgi:hypothetical protein